MRKFFNLFALIITVSAIFILTAGQANAQFQFNYSSNMWVNSGMNQLFQKRWAIARIRAAGKNELADAMEGRRTNGGRVSTPDEATENVLRRVPLSETSLKSSRAAIMPLVLGARLTGAAPEESRTLIKAASYLLGNYEEMLVKNKESRLKNNVAGAAAFALVMSRSILMDGKNELSEKQSEAVLQDINALLASSDKFKQLPEIEKQKMYEIFVISSGLAAMLYQQGRENDSAEMAANGKELAKTVLAQFFERPLDEIQFTDEGVNFGN